MYRVYNVSQLLRAGEPNTLGLWAAAGWADYFSFVRNAAASLSFLCCLGLLAVAPDLLAVAPLWFLRAFFFCAAWLWLRLRHRFRLGCGSCAQAERSLPADDTWESDRRGL